MPFGINWIDIIIVIIAIISFIQGIRAGFIKSIFTLTGLVAALLAALRFYSPLSTFAAEYIPLPRLFLDPFFFIFVFLIVISVIYYVGALVSSITLISLFKLIDKAAGSLSGLIIGLLITGLLLIIFTALPLYPGFDEQARQSRLASAVMGTTVSVFENYQDYLPFELPRFISKPETLSLYMNSITTLTEHSNINFVSLDSSTCFVCGNEVQFIGYIDNAQDSFSPKFICSECGRTSDGCQTYEGYHLMYDECPVALGNKGYRLDCGIWPNQNYQRASGPCIVCGTD